MVRGLSLRENHPPIESQSNFYMILFLISEYQKI